MKEESVTVLCYGGHRHGDWTEVPSHPPVFMVYGRPDDRDIGRSVTTYRYFRDEVDVRFDGVRLFVQLAVCESKHERVGPDELAQFTLGHAIARLAIRPATIRDKHGMEIPR